MKTGKLAVVTMYLTFSDKFKANIAIVLLVVTLLALALQYTLTKTFVIDPSASVIVNVTDDRVMGGKSQASFSTSEDGFIFRCDIIASDFSWPYCELSFDLSQNGRGMDLRPFDKAKIWYEYQGENKTGIRFQTRNFDPRYSSRNDPRSMKFNVVEVYEKHLSNPIVVPFEYFSVPTWWLEERKQPLDASSVQFDNTMDIIIVTGSEIEVGQYQLNISKIELIGKYIRDTSLYLTLLLMWVAVALLYLFDKFFAAKREIDVARRRQRELESLVRMLNVTKKELENKLTRDALTGALNREGVAKVFEYKYAHEEQELSVIFMDLDHFKKINDTHGHNTGDKILIQFVNLIKANTREGDVLARWGGEEFLLACPDTNLEHAQQLAEKLRACITQHKWHLGLNLTASFGVAQMQQELVTEFIGRADEALYLAKEQGRNRVVTA